MTFRKVFFLSVAMCRINQRSKCMQANSSKSADQNCSTKGKVKSDQQFTRTLTATPITPHPNDQGPDFSIRKKGEQSKTKKV